jgi:hypothetical protein
MSETWDEMSERWEREKAFWARYTGVPTYELEETGSGYGGSYRDMVKVQVSSNGVCFGDWVRSSDFRAVIERLEARIEEQDRNYQDALEAWNVEIQLRLQERKF